MKATQLLMAMSVLTAALVGPVRAQAPDSLRALVATAEILPAAGSPSARTGDPRVLRPGELVRYRLAFTNITRDSVRNVQFSDPVPGGLRYVAGSARADRANVLIEFSIDAGRSYSARPEVEEIVNGKKVRRAAPPESYTHVRWSVPGWVRPKTKVTAEFSAQLPVATVARVNQ